MNLHLAPADPRLKNRALDVARKVTLRLHRATGRAAMVVMAGDLNMVRCRTLAVRPERAGCRPRPAHERLEQAGFVDAVRARNRRGPYGVVGVRGRIDFIYTLDEVRSSAWDRCYLAYLVTVDPCGDRAVFRSKEALHECQRRADQAGRPGGLCPARQYRRYYSDHPIMRANLTR